MVTYNHIIDAHQRIREVVINTPIIESVSINKQLGGRVLFKVEALQKTGSFKFRGAYNKISQLAQNSDSGIVAYSSGNHAQGIAAAAMVHNVPSVIVMPEDAPRMKIENTLSYGAEVVYYDRMKEIREEIGERIAKERNFQLIRPYDDPLVIAGQGTCGLEIAQQAKKFGINEAEVLVCCGGGGLSAGIALALEKLTPSFIVRTCEPEFFDDTARSLKSGNRENTFSLPNPHHLADLNIYVNTLRFKL